MERIAQRFLSRCGLLLILTGLLLAGGPRAQDGPADERWAASVGWEQAVRRGEARWQEGNFEGAFSWMELALNIARKQEEPRKELQCLTSLGRLSWALGRPKAAQEFYQEASEAAAEISSPIDIATIGRARQTCELYLQARVERQARRPDAAVRLLKEAAEIAREIRHPEAEVKCLRQLSLAFLENRDFQQFLSANERTLGLARKLNDRRELAAAYQNFGLFHYQLRNFSAAMDYYSLALEISEAGKFQDIESMCLKNIGVMLLDLGFYERSLEFLERAANVERQIANYAITIQSFNNLGEAYRNKGLIFSHQPDLYKAWDFFREALEATHKFNNQIARFVSLHNIGNLHLDLGRFHSALHYLEAAAGIAAETNDQEAIARISLNQAICHLRLKDYAQAHAHLNRASLDPAETREHPMAWEILFYQGKCNEALGLNDAALEDYRASLRAIDELRARIGLDEFRAGFGRSKLKVYESLAFLLHRLKEDRSGEVDREIYEVVEKAKARAFLETLAAMEIENHDEGSSPENIKKPPFPRPASLAEIRARLLDDRTAIVEFFLGEDQSLLFLVTENHLKLYPLPAKRTVEKSVFAYLRLLSEPPKTGWNGGPASRRLAEELLGPALTDLPAGIEHLIIIPDGILFDLPFETLSFRPDPKRSGEEYLLKRYEISYAVSSSSLLHLLDRRAGTPGKRFLALGNPVNPIYRKGEKNRPLGLSALIREIYESAGGRSGSLRRSEKEIRDIARLYPPEKTDLFLKAEASEKTVKTLQLENYNAIHFACHGFEDDRVPLRSGLFLSPGEEKSEDGYLRAEEIARLRLNAELVVLSACQSGKGYMEKGEGTMGLPRAFFISGARSVVSSLWQVSDPATAEFMRRFYENLSRKMTKVQALREAKLRMLRSRYTHPFYWAAFVLHGDPFRGLDFD